MTEAVFLKAFKVDSISFICRQINYYIARFRKFGKNALKAAPIQAYPISHPSGKVGFIYPEIPIASLTENTFLDLKPAFKRCGRKYFFTPCIKYNEGTVSFKCKDPPDGKNETTHSQTCLIQAYNRVGLVGGLSIGDESGNQMLEGTIFPYMIGDGAKVKKMDYKVNSQPKVVVNDLLMSFDQYAHQHDDLVKELDTKLE